MDLSSIFRSITQNTTGQKLNLSQSMSTWSQWYHNVISYPNITTISEYSYSTQGIETPSQQYTVAYAVNKIFIISPRKIDFDPSLNINHMLIFDMQQNKFLSIEEYQYITPVTAMESCVVSYSSSVTERTYIYVIGGIRHNNSTNLPEYHTKTQRYIVEDDEWTIRADMNTPRGGTGCAMDKDNKAIFVFGGYNDEDGELDTIEQYHWDDADLWLTETSGWVSFIITFLLFVNTNTFYMFVSSLSSTKFVFGWNRFSVLDRMF